MNYKTIFEKNEVLKKLIRTESTGSPEQLAQRMNISVSTVYRMVKTLKELGEPIAYSRIRQTYYYK